MTWLCEAQIAQFASMKDFNIDSVVKIQHALEYIITEKFIDKIALKIKKQINVPARRYGISGLLMGEMGYYNPSIIIEHIYTNVNRGRLLKKRPASPVFIYDFDQAKNLARVVNNDLQTTTYVMHNNSYNICISISNIENDIVSIILELKDNFGRICRWIQFRWHSHMKIAYGMGAEVYQYTDEGNTCITFSGINDGHGTIMGLACNEYHFETNTTGKISSFEWIR